jgi:predicted MPP superfamily phosphohydrolase
MKISLRCEQIRWRQGMENLKLLHLSDLHVKWNGRVLWQIEKEITQITPDVIVMTGDYHDTPRGAAHFHDFVERISGLHPVCWISGNHDRWFGDRHEKRLLEIKNAHFVDDASWVFTSSAGHRYRFLSWSLHSAGVHQTMDPDERRIVLLHNPEEIVAEHLAGCDLLLAGHLHGGQFILHECTDGSFFPGNLLYHWCCDRREVGNTSVIVSKGLGDTLPLRFRCPKELVCVEIQ